MGVLVLALHYWGGGWLFFKNKNTFLQVGLVGCFFFEPDSFFVFHFAAGKNVSSLVSR